MSEWRSRHSVTHVAYLLIVWTRLGSLNRLRRVFFASMPQPIIGRASFFVVGQPRENRRDPDKVSKPS
ncbi:hypothetical protein VTH06DRAFT_4350 [Thermothelomyces fergusii]